MINTERASELQAIAQEICESFEGKQLSWFEIRYVLYVVHAQTTKNENYIELIEQMNKIAPQ